MSVKTKLARQAVKTTAKHTAHGTASKFTRQPFRSLTLLALGALFGIAVGWLIGRSGGDQGHEPVEVPAAPGDPLSSADNSTGQAAQTGIAS